MGNFTDNLKKQYTEGSILIKIIFINVATFLLLNVVKIIGVLFKIQSIDTNSLIGVPASIELILIRPWTLISYMFAHFGLFHLAFNMLLLFWFGKIFLNYFSPKNLGSLYILGGLSGAILYILAFNTIPYYIDMGYPTMVGASASVTAIIFASAFYNPNNEVQLLLLGRIKIIYIAAFIFIIDFLAIGNPENPGGHIAHIGGAIIGYIFAIQFKKGNDITNGINKAIDWVLNLFKPTKIKVKSKRNETDYEFNQRKHKNEEEIDKILDKLKASGYNSLSKEDKKRLFDASKK